MLNTVVAPKVVSSAVRIVCIHVRAHTVGDVNFGENVVGTLGGHALCAT
jgi:hypothetical protein